MSTYDAFLLSDIYKDLYGFRPGEAFFHEWDTLSEAGKQAKWDSMCAELEEVIEEERKEQNRSIKEFENRVEAQMAITGMDRESVLNSMEEALTGTYGDCEYLEYHYNLPYGYLR